MQPDGNIRPLPFPLSWQEDSESETPNTPVISHLSLDGWGSLDSDERVNVVLNLSLNEYVALATAVDVGCDIAYGENSIYVWWIWVRSLVSMSLCDDVADCIVDSEAVQNSLNSFIQTNTGFSTPNDNIESQERMIADSPTCDFDELWGNSVALWTSINQVTIDFLEILAASTNINQLFADVISAIPVLNQAPVDEMLDLIDQMTTWLLENYNAALTVSLTQQIECDLFCIMIENCGITFEQVFSYFSEYFSIDLNSYQLVQMLAWLTGVNPAGEQFVYAMTAFQLFIVGIAERFLGIPTTAWYAIQAQLGEPDNDWEILCTDCTWVHEFDFTVDEQGWALYTGAGQTSGTNGEYIASTGWSATNTAYVPSASYYRQVWLEIAVSPETNITEVEMIFDYTKGMFGTVATAAHRIQTDNENIQVSSNDVVSGDDQVLGLDDENTANWIRLRLDSSRNNTAIYSGDALITKCIVRGTGFDPF